MMRECYVAGDGMSTENSIMTPQLMIGKWALQRKSYPV